MENKQKERNTRIARAFIIIGFVGIFTGVSSNSAITIIGFVFLVVGIFKLKEV